MKRIQDSGWQRYIYLSSPRLTGKDAIRYFQGEENFGLGDITDPGVVPDFNTWYSVISQGGFIVHFYLDGVEMTILFERKIIPSLVPPFIFLMARTAAKAKPTG